MSNSWIDQQLQEERDDQERDILFDQTARTAEHDRALDDDERLDRTEQEFILREDEADSLLVRPTVAPQSGWVSPRAGVFEDYARGEEDEPEERIVSSLNDRETGASAERVQPAEVGRPRGHINKRLVMAAAAIILVFAVMFLGGGRKRTDAKAADTGQAARSARELETNAPRQFTAAGDGTLGSPSSQYVAPPPPPVAPIEPPPPAPPAPTPAPSPAPEPTQDPQFAVQLKAGQREDKLAGTLENEADKQLIKEAKSGGVTTGAPKGAPSPIPSGTKIDMRLDEPLRSGVATIVAATVLSDIRDKEGKVIIPRGSTAGVPFMPYEVNKRVVSDRRRDIVFTTPDGQQVTLKGMVKGSDGYAGLTGKVTNVGGGSKLGKVLGTVARTGARVAGGVVGDYSSEAEREIDRTAYDYSNTYFERSSRVVEIQANARFYLIVGW